MSLCGQKGPAGTVRDFGEGHGHTAIFKMDDQLGPAAAHGTLLHVMCQPAWEGGLTCICMAESLHCT